MPLRIGFDIDGVFADMVSAYREVDARLFGSAEVEDDVPEPPELPKPTSGAEGSPEGLRDEKGEGEKHKKKETAKEHPTTAAPPLADQQHRREAVWHAIEATENFWTTLKPLDPNAVRRLADLARRHHWEIFFLTQRPDTAGETAQRQTQRWLTAQGFDLPSVIVVRGTRGKVAAALELDYLVDDTPKNCVDVKAESKATRAILIMPNKDLPSERNARWLGIAVARSVSEALDLLEQAQGVRSSPTLWQKLAKTVGWT
jgi:hypothetical protein